MSITPANVRNFAIAGHAGSGKTSLADLILFKSGAVQRLGKVDQKTSVADYRPEEHTSGYSIYAVPLHCQWEDHDLFFTDTPGSADFFGETTAALNVCDIALVVVDGANGIEVGTSRACKTLRALGCPRAFFINTLDRDNSDFDRVLGLLRDAYGATACIPITVPIGKEADLSGVFSVLQAEDVPDEIADSVGEYRSALMDTVAESDEDLMMRYLDGEVLSEEEVSRGLHAAVIDGSLIPVFAGSVERDIGVAELLNGIVNLFPNPLQRPPPAMDGDATIEITADGGGAAFVYKSIMDPFIGQLCCFRVYSGTISSDSELRNVTQNSKERIGTLIHLCGKEQTQITSAGPGELVAVAKLKHTHINDTLSVITGHANFKPITFPRPSMSYACYAVKSGEEDKISTGLQRLAEGDPTVVIDRQKETHELLLSGMGDQHLRIIVDRLKDMLKVSVDLRTPKVPYRETINASGEGKYRHKKQSGGHGQFAEVWLRVEPLPDAEYEFENKVVGGRIPKNFIPAVEKGVVEAMVNGPLASCKVINIKITVFDGKDHPVDSSEMAFKIAARSAFKAAMLTANAIILEPIMDVRIESPNQYMGDITGDLNSRRGRILGMEMEEGMQVVKAQVPQGEMFNYSPQLRSITQGQGSFEMEFSRYEQVPGDISAQIQKAASSGQADEDE